MCSTSVVVIALRAPICSMEISEGGGRGAEGVGGWDVDVDNGVEVEVVVGAGSVGLGGGLWLFMVVEEEVEVPERLGSVRISTTVSAQKALYPSRPKSESGFSGDPNLPSRLESSYENAMSSLPYPLR